MRLVEGQEANDMPARLPLVASRENGSPNSV